MNLSLLTDIRVIVVHSYCSDGTASAMILQEVFPSARVIDVTYDAVRSQLACQPGMLFCDMTPPDERVEEFVRAGAVVLDHHRTRQHVVRAFGERGVYACEDSDPGVAGAALAVREVWDPYWSAHPDMWTQAHAKRVSELALLASVRDTWQRSSPWWQRAVELDCLLRFLGLDRALEMGIAAVCASPQWLSSHLEATNRRKAANAASKCTMIETAGLRVAVLGGMAAVNDAADLVEADALAGFAYKMVDGQNMLKVSLRSRGKLDVGEIARALGGGGHAHAASFLVKVAPSSLNPFSEISQLIELGVSKAKTAPKDQP